MNDIEDFKPGPNYPCIIPLVVYMILMSFATYFFCKWIVS